MGARSAQEIWEAALGELQIQVSKPNYRTWLGKTVGLNYQDNRFVVGVPDTFVAEYLDKKQRSLIEKTLIGITGHEVEVHFQVDSRHQLSDSREEPPLRLNPKYTFDSFIVGNSNRLAHAAALTVAENPGRSYNPLFIYGGAGLGKTHLLQAIGHLAIASHIKVLYVSSEQFTNEFIQAIRGRKTDEFRDKYRTIDMLLIDDIQFISGKESTEESFFHTFNDLHNANRQIAITSDSSPKVMPLLEERLRSRFEWGLVANIQLPDLETRLAILQAKVEQKGAKINPDVLEFIAYRVQQSIRELEGCLNRVIAYTKLLKAPATPELAAEVLNETPSKPDKTAHLTPALVIEAVANSFNLTPLDLKSQKRKQATLARQVAIYLLRQESNFSLAQIGKELGGRDPSFVSRAYTKIKTDIDNSPYLRHLIPEIQQRIRQKSNTH